MLNVLSICTGMGLFDLAFRDAGFNVVPGCEISPRMRNLYRLLLEDDREHLAHDIRYLKQPGRFAGVIGGPPCQAHSKLRAMRKTKFGDLTAEVKRVLEEVQPDWFLFENVVPIEIPGASTVCLDAMHFSLPHQSRKRWFTYSPNLTPPRPIFSGNVDDLMAYPIVAGRIYGKRRAAILQGYPAAANLSAPSSDVRLGLANAVAYPVGKAWAKSVLGYIRYKLCRAEGS